jgi:Glutathione S-transferase, N-terminal domain
MNARCLQHIVIQNSTLKVPYTRQTKTIHQLPKTLSSQVKMEEGRLKLMGMWVSPYANKVRMMLEQKDLSYEYIEQEIFSNKSELLLKSNPIYKKVPVLIHHDRSICESFVILHYIDETWSGTGPPVLPADPYERALARFWAQFLEDKVLKLLIVLFRSTVIYMKKKIRFFFLTKFVRLFFHVFAVFTYICWYGEGSN